MIDFLKTQNKLNFPARTAQPNKPSTSKYANQQLQDRQHQPPAVVVVATPAPKFNTVSPNYNFFSFTN